MQKSSVLNIIDKAVFVFTLIFLLTLTNSIFLNQLGYYGALILLLLKYALTKENPFRKSGLELAFILFIIAELLSSVFSVNQGNAFFFMLKRVLLLPIVYTMIGSADSERKGKTYFYVYITAASASVLVYLFFSYRHFILNLYNIQQSGPSLFQYPITASEIMSFTVIILFAFLVNEKTKLKYRILIFSGFALSALALFSTYKRTGWIGTLAGILVILILKKQWKILAAGAAALLLIILLQKNVSLTGVYSLNEKRMIGIYHTEGRAYNILAEDDKYYLSDFQNGVLTYQDSLLLSKSESPAPVTALYHWKEDYYAAFLLDTRFVLLKNTGDSFSPGDEFLTPGFTVSAASSNGFLYVLDSDSGLTIFRDPDDLNNKMNFKEFSGFKRFFADENFAVAASPDSVVISRFVDGIPSDSYIRQKTIANSNLLFYKNGRAVFSGPEGLSLVSIDEKGFKLLDKSKDILSAYLAAQSDNRLFVMTTSGVLYTLEYPLFSEIKVTARDNLPYIPGSISVQGENIYFSYVKESRILSIFDPYNPSNFTRFALWRAGWEMFKDYPVFGTGDIDLQKLYVKYKRPYDKEIQGHLHNNFVHILATLGAVGFIIVCFLMYRIIIINLHIFRSFDNSRFYSSYALGVTGAFFSVLAAGLTEVNIWDHEILTLVLFTTGLNISFYYNVLKKEL